MKVTEKKAPNGKVILDVVASTGEVGRALDIAQLMFAQQMNLAPSKSKTVAKVAEEQLGIRDLDSIVQSQAIENLIPYALDKKNVIPAFPPKPQVYSALKRGHTFSFALEVVLKPSYELTSYEPVTVKAPEFVPNLSEVDTRLGQMAEAYAEYITDDPHPVAEGDHCLISLDATLDGEVLAGLSTDGRTYTTGIGLMPAGFEEALIGMEVGETKSFSFEAPKTDGQDDATPDVVECVLTIKEIQKKVVSSIDDEWVKKFTPMYPDAEALRQALTEQIIGPQRDRYNQYVYELAISELESRFNGHIANEIYEAAAKQKAKVLKEEVSAQGMSFEEFVRKQGGEQNLTMMMMEKIREELIKGYVLDAVFKHEGLRISDVHIDAAAQNIDPQNAKQIREQMEQTGRGFVLREIAERICASEFVLANAEVIEIPTDK